jgi:Tfp pilus assembly protein PilF
MHKGLAALAGLVALAVTLPLIVRMTTPAPNHAPPEAPPASVPAETSPPLVRLIVRVEEPAPEVAEPPGWLNEEVRYLLARQGAVRLAHPDGPNEPRPGFAIAVLSIDVPSADDARPIELALNAADGHLSEFRDLGAVPGTRLALIERIATELGRVAAHDPTRPALTPSIGTANAAVYDAYTRTHVAALRAMREGQEPAGDSRMSPRAIERLELMTRRDPRFARGWSALALGYLELGGKDEDALARLADRAARRALALDPGLPEAEAALGRTRYRYGQWLEAEDHLVAALAADPAAPTALEAYTCFLLDLGRIGYAIRTGAQALGTVPGADDARECLATAMFESGDAPGARRLLGSAQDTEPQGITRTRALFELLDRDYDAAEVTLANAIPKRRNAAALAAPVIEAVKDPAATAAALRALTRAADIGSIDATTETMIGVLLGQADFVFNRLTRMRRLRQAVPLRLLWLPQSAYLRDHARFHEIVDQFELDTYWGQRSPPDFCKDAPTLPGCR